ncbi:MAG: DUF2807 domain-containing protein, partial [Parvularculaceae bacterium]|nr:DUF2807 domain-containing protein [Parvularculaceae bacterium]
MRALSVGLLAAASTIGLSAAQAEELVIQDFFGTVELELSGSQDITVAKSGPDASSVTIRGGSDKVVDGGEEINRNRWYKSYQNKRRGWNGNRKRDEDPVFEEMLKERPTLTISAPVGTDIIVEGSAVKLTVTGGDAGAVDISDNVHLLAKLGDFAEGKLSVHGSGYMSAGDVAGDFQGSVHGSGDLYVGNVGRAQVSVHGSGDMIVKDVNGPLDASVHGSGDLNTGDVAGKLQASVHGSGDLEIASVEGSGEANVHGSGDLEIDSIGAGLESSVHGSGDLSVGRVDGDIEATIHGSGELDIARGKAG